MKAHPEVVDLLGGVTEISRFTQIPIGTISSWKTRGGIHSRYWKKLIEMARHKRVKGINAVALLATQVDS